MRKPAFVIFCGLCILTSFSLLTVNVRGVSNKHCLLPFFHFYSGWIRTLVAMATYSSHRLIMGKVENCNFFLSQWRYLDFFTEMFIE